MSELYRHFDRDGKLLYVGISLCSITRLTQHRSTAKWFKDVARVEIERFQNRASAAKAERDAIRNERPIFNVLLRPSDRKRFCIHVSKNIFNEFRANFCKDVNFSFLAEAWMRRQVEIARMEKK